MKLCILMLVLIISGGMYQSSRAHAESSERPSALTGLRNCMLPIQILLCFNIRYRH